MDNHKNFRANIPAFAIDALDPDEAEALRHHLETCSACRAELATYHQVADALVLAVPAHEPPQTLKSRLLDSVESAEEETAVAEPIAVITNWYDWFFRPRTFQIALGLGLLALLIGNVVMWRLQRPSVIDENPDKLQAFALVGDANLPTASGYVIVSADGLSGAVVVDELPVLAEDEAYQLWLIQPDGRRDSGAIFNVDELGYGGSRIVPSRPLWEYSGFGVTVEPAEGSDAPTGERVLSGELP